MAQFRKDTHKYLPQETTIFEVVMLADQYGNLVGPANPSGMSVDAFGRARMSTPLTLFDSSHRYRDNGLWAQSNSSGTTITFSPNEGLINLAVTTTASQEIIRETTKVFSYQPGKSLQILNTVVFAPQQLNLRQRVGYFGANNGIYLEQSNNEVYFVERSYTGGTMSETKVAQADWNQDTLLGAVDSSSSQKTLDLSKAQIFFTDIEWLGLGTVRCGFVIDGQLIHCHSFHHANYITSTYMTTASLPIRYEIKNIGTTGNNSIMKQVCSTVISEGGYELRGEQKTVGMDTPTSNNYTLTSLNIYYPVCSIRLKSDRLDAIVIPKNISLVGTTASDYRYKIIVGASITGGNWVSAGSDSSVEYNINATSQSGGKELFSSYLISTGSQSLTAKLEDGIFRYQLERNGLTSTPTTFTLVVSSKANGDKVLASLDWEEISR
jgi:hypothetical protein